MSREDNTRQGNRDKETEVNKPVDEAMDVANPEPADEQELQQQRRKMGPTMSKAQRKTARLMKYVPKGYTHRLIDPTDERIDELMDKDWIFAKDENGGKVFATRNHDLHTNEPKQVLVIKREDWYEEDKRAATRKRVEALRARSKDTVVDGVPTGKTSNDPFFRDIGISADSEDI